MVICVLITLGKGALRSVLREEDEVVGDPLTSCKRFKYKDFLKLSRNFTCGKS